MFGFNTTSICADMAGTSSNVGSRLHLQSSIRIGDCNRAHPPPEVSPLPSLQAADKSLSWLDGGVGALRSGFQMHAQDKTNRRLGELNVPLLPQNRLVRPGAPGRERSHRRSRDPLDEGMTDQGSVEIPR